MPIFPRAAAPLALLGLIMASPHARATTVTYGTITACYYSIECTYVSAAGLSGVVDGPAFEFTNTSDVTITNASFAVAANKTAGITADSFKIGKIKPGASFVIVVGVSNDKKVRASTKFFYYSGSPTDTSDENIDSNSVAFSFHGTVGTAKVISGKIVTGATAGPSADGTVSLLNFLGGPGNADGPCNDCFTPKQIGTIHSVPVTSAVPPIEKGMKP